MGIVGKYLDPVYAESLLASGSADMVAMTRALIADPELPIKAMDGRLYDIRPCIGVLQDCWGRMIRGLPISCTVNPVVSREKSWAATPEKTASPKKLLVIGGGPAGLEAARVAAERGHRVTVYEKGNEPGGQALLAAKLPGRENIRAIITWLLTQTKKLHVEIKCGLEVTAEEEVLRYVLEEEKPDAVIVATGSNPIRTGFQPYTFNEIEGWNQKNVFTDFEVFDDLTDFGKKLVIGDSLSFIEAPGIAEYLAKKGKEVHIVTPLDNIGLELNLLNHWDHLLPRIFTLDVNIHPFTWIKKIDGRTVTLYNFYYHQKETIMEDVDSVILTTGKMQNDSLYESLRGRVPELYVIGDAKIGGARIGNAFYDGQKIGREI
jgi:thioredoxin reductase